MTDEMLPADYWLEYAYQLWTPGEGSFFGPQDATTTRTENEVTIRRGDRACGLSYTPPQDGSEGFLLFAMISADGSVKESTLIASKEDANHAINLAREWLALPPAAKP